MVVQLPWKKGLIQWNCYIYNNIQKQPRHNLRFQPPIAQVTMAKPSPESKTWIKPTKVLQMFDFRRFGKAQKMESFLVFGDSVKTWTKIILPHLEIPHLDLDPPPNNLDAGKGSHQEKQKKKRPDIYRMPPASTKKKTCWKLTPFPPKKKKKNDSLRLWKNCLFCFQHEKKIIEKSPKKRKSPSNRLSTSAFRGFGTWLCCWWWPAVVSHLSHNSHVPPWNLPKRAGHFSCWCPQPVICMLPSLKLTVRTWKNGLFFPKAKMVSQAIIFSLARC